MVIKGVMDEVRRQGEVEYPEKAESCCVATAAMANLRWIDFSFWGFWGGGTKRRVEKV